MDGWMEGNYNLDHAVETENLLNTLPNFHGFPMQESHHNPPPSSHHNHPPPTGNRHLRPEIDPFYSGDGWPQSRALMESVRTGNMRENYHPPSPAAGPAARNHPLQPNVSYTDNLRHQNLAARYNGAIYTPPVFARNNLQHLHQQDRWDPFCAGGERFLDSTLMYHSRVNPSIPDNFSLEDEFTRLKLLEDHQQPRFPELLSVDSVAAPEVRNSSSLDWLRGKELPPHFSNGDLQVLRAQAAAEGFKLPQAYPTFSDSFLIPDSYWVKRDFDVFKNILGDMDAYNRRMSIDDYKPRNGLDSSKHFVSSIPPPPCNGYIHGSTQRVNYCSLEDLIGRVFSEAMDQYGFRFLLLKLDERKPEDIQMILSEVKDHIYTLMNDRFGSHVIQKLFEVCDQEQMSRLVFSVTADDHLLMDVCLDPQGSQSMQKFVECLRAPEQICHMISIFRRITVPLVNNHIGSRVIQHCLNTLPADETEKILDVIADNCFQIATKRSGCCLLQVFITRDCPLESQRRIVAGIVLNIHELSKNQFGNYVVQHVMGLQIPNVVKGMVAGLRGNFVSLSMDKYGSNVVERLMKVSQGKYAPQIINEIISSPSFLNVALDPFGNYVIQFAKKCATGDTRKTLNNLILQYYNLLHSHLFGRNVVNKERTRHWF